MPKYTFKSQYATEFEYIAPKSQNPTVLYLHGFCSNPWGRKPDTVKEYCEKYGVGFYRFEFAGHGSDESNFESADFNIWKNQVIEIIDNVLKGDVYLVGSSMGGWISLLAAIERPERIKGIVGLAAAPNFIKLFEPYMTPEQKQQLIVEGKFRFGNDDFEYTITKKFIDSALENCLDDTAKQWDINCPVHLLQGMKDASYAWRGVLDIAKKIAHENVVVKIMKNADHRLGDDKSIQELFNSLVNIVNI